MNLRNAYLLHIYATTVCKKQKRPFNMFSSKKRKNKCLSQHVSNWLQNVNLFLRILSTLLIAIFFNVLFLWIRRPKCYNYYVPVRLQKWIKWMISRFLHNFSLVASDTKTNIDEKLWFSLQKCKCIRIISFLLNWIV